MARKIISSYRAKTKVKRRKHSKNASKGQIGYKKNIKDRVDNGRNFKINRKLRFVCSFIVR